MELSKAGYALVKQMLLESSSLKYGYRKIVEGCYDYCIHRYGMELPQEPKAIIVSKVIEILNSNNS